MLMCSFFRWLLAKHRESQQDYYAKTGIPWQLLTGDSCIEVNGRKMLETLCHACIVDRKAPQDSDAVVSQLIETLKLYGQSHQHIDMVHVKSDNAACYKCQQGIIALWAQRKSIDGLEIASYSFSEQQAGKDRCDTVS